MEDLDPQRSKQEYVDAMVEDLAWLGIEWEPPMLSQSMRMEAYREAFDRLLSAGAVYPCTCSRRELAQMTRLRTRRKAVGLRRRMSRCIAEDAVLRAIPTGRHAASTRTQFRFRVPDGAAVEFEDRNFGRQSYTAGRESRRLSGVAQAAGAKGVWRA